MEKFLIIDGNSLLNRAFYALPLLSNKEGEYSNAVYGFTNILIRAITTFRPKYIAVAFDFGKKTFRNELYTGYKIKRRETPSELVSQFTLMKKLLKKMNIEVYEKSGIEADDIIGVLAKNSRFNNIILSGDKDVLQLISDKTEVWLTKRGISDVETVNLNNVVEKFGLKPKQIIDLKALAGDSSDSIPGVSGIGNKTAMILLEKFLSVEGIYENIDKIEGKLKEKLLNDKDMAFLSKKLATIDCDASIDFDLDKCVYEFPFGEEVFRFFEQYDFNSLLKRSEIFMSQFPMKEQPNDIECEIIKVDSSDTIDIILKSIKETNKLAFDVSKDINLSISPNYRYFMENDITLFNLGKNIDVYISQLKTIFEDDNIEKFFYDYKKAWHFLKDFQIEILGKIFDISLAKYLISGGERQSVQNTETEKYFEEKKQLTEQLIKQDMFNLYFNIELPLVSLLARMEREGFKIDKNKLMELSVKYNEELDNISKEIYAISGVEFNINSPKQLSEVLFEKLQIKCFNNKKNSTSIDILNEIAYAHPVIPLIIRYRKIQKLYGTYIVPYKTIVSQTGGLIHTVFNQTLTATGRLSSSEPNLQNIPVRDDEGKSLRKIFVSKFKNGKIMSADYNQIELRLLANFSKDKHLIDAFLHNQDIHASTAAKIFKKPIEEITAYERRSAKAVNFGVIYGISDYGLSQSIGITRKQAKEYIDKYFELYPEVKIYLDNNVLIAREKGFVTTYFGRKRKIDDINSSNFNLRTFSERVAKNMPLQGTASDVIKIAMVNVDKAFRFNKLKSHLILQIHDELIVDVYENEEKIVAEILKKEMESVIDLPVKIPVDISVGESWFDCK